MRFESDRGAAVSWRRARLLGLCFCGLTLTAANLVHAQSASGLVRADTAESELPITPTTIGREGHIHLDVDVRDRAGKPVLGLTDNNLTLLEDGVPQTIRSFRASSADNDNERLNEVIVVLDQVNLSPVQFDLAKRETIRFLRQNDGHLAHPVSVYWFTGTGLFGSVLSTTNGNALADDIAHNHVGRTLWTIPPMRAGVIDIDDVVKRRYLLWTKALQAVYSIAVERRDKPGRKLLVWIGFGWPVVSGILEKQEGNFDMLVELSTRIREARLVIAQIYGWPDPQIFNFPYTIYLEGVRSASELAKPDIGGIFARFALPVLAIQSGGLVLDESQNIPQAIEHLIQDASAFYTISFDPPHAASIDEYHDLKLTVDRPGSTTRTSTGYYNQPVFYDQPRVPTKRVTVQELGHILDADGGKHDGDLAEELNGLELTERLSTGKFATWRDRLRGKKSKTALTALADASVFCEPPSAEIPPDPPPDHDAQVQMLRRTVKYLDEVVPRLPDFFATRTKTQFEQRSAKEEDTWKTALADQTIHEGATEIATLLYRNGHERQIVEARKSKGTIKNDLNFIGIFGPILYSVLHDAMTGGNGLVWGRWETGEQGTDAVFRYDVHSKAPFNIVENCCLRSGEIFRDRARYHGEISVDPGTGTILRLTMESEPGWFVETDLSPVRPIVRMAMMVEFGPMEIGGKKYICPKRSVVVSRTRPVRPLKVDDVDLDVYAPYETLLDDISYSNYHKFGSESRILPGFDVVPDAKEGGKAPPGH